MLPTNCTSKISASSSQTALTRIPFAKCLSATLQPRAGAQEFRFPETRAKYVRLLIRNGHNASANRVQLAEFEVYTPDNVNVLLSHSARRTSDGPKLIALQLRAWVTE